MQARLLRPLVVSMVLATARGNRHRAVADVLLWVAGLVLIVTLAAVAVMALRRRLRGRLRESQAIGFSLDQLCEMKERGELSDAEYKALRRTLIEQLDPARDAGGG